MHLSVGSKLSRLPKRLPVGTTYVIEGRGGENGHFRVLSRYVVLPGGRRISLGDDLHGPATSRLRRSTCNAGDRQARRAGKNRLGRTKKIMARGGTAGRERR